MIVLWREGWRPNSHRVCRLWLEGVYLSHEVPLGGRDQRRVAATQAMGADNAQQQNDADSAHTSGVESISERENRGGCSCG